MSDDGVETWFEREREIGLESPTLIEGLPGSGMVASIAVDRITDQLDLASLGHIKSDAFPPVAAFHEGRIRETIRVYGSAEPAIMTLQSDVPIPEGAVEELSACIHTDLAESFEDALFLAGAPAQSEQQRGQVAALATTDEMEAALTDAEIDLVGESGAIGGITGGLVSGCYERDLSAAVLLVQCDPRLPDPWAAKVVIEEALEPLVDFDVDTTELEEQAQTIQAQKEQIAQQHQRMAQGEREEPMQSQAMYH